MSDGSKLGDIILSMAATFGVAFSNQDAVRLRIEAALVGMSREYSDGYVQYMLGDSLYRSYFGER